MRKVQDDDADELTPQERQASQARLREYEDMAARVVDQHFAAGEYGDYGPEDAELYRRHKHTALQRLRRNVGLSPKNDPPGQITMCGQ